MDLNFQEFFLIFFLKGKEIELRVTQGKPFKVISVDYLGWFPLMSTLEESLVVNF
jgi:hypothetical protein